ncbi:hypothetical protein ACOK4R_31795 (plasmid) [Pseudomonas fluorescens]|uniref:hypothetical protein n=1 Tax=Pseudomonas fluorescens TaxID=294 RepID=UPI0031455844
MSYDTYKAFERSMLDAQFDAKNSLDLLAQNHSDSLYETVKNVMHAANILPQVDRVQLTERMFEVIALRHQKQRVAKPLFLRLLLAYGPVLKPEQLDKLMGDDGVLKVDVDDLNQSFEGVYQHPALSLNLNVRHQVNAQSIGYLCKRLWGWYALEDHLSRQVGRCESSAIVGELLAHEPFAHMARRLTLKTQVLEDPRVLAHVVAHKAYKSSENFRVLSAGLRTPDEALFQATLETVSGWSRAESTHYMQHSTAQVMCVLLGKDFRGATGDLKRRVEIANSVFSEIGNTARKGREDYMSAVGMAL